MKKGISLIVLVITIIVLAILAGAIILSLSNTNLIKETTQTRMDADLANAKNAVNLAYADAIALGLQAKAVTGKAYSEAPTLNDAGQITGGVLMDEDDYYDAIGDAFGKSASWAEDVYTIEVDDETGCPTSVTANGVATN